MTGNQHPDKPDRPRRGPSSRAASSLGFGTVSFEEWVTSTASHLTEDLDGRHHYERDAPGGVSEAAAYLLSGAGLAPDEDGHPTLGGHGGISKLDDYEKLAMIMYSVAFPKEQYSNRNLDLFVSIDPDFADTEPPEERELVTVIKAVGILLVSPTGDPPSRAGSVLVFHEPALPLSEISRETLDGLKELHERVCSSAICSTG